MEIKDLEELKKLAALLLKSQKRFNMLSDKRANADLSTHTQRAIEKMNADLNWHAMEHDQLKHEIHAVLVDLGLSEPRDNYGFVEYTPSPFHKYRYNPPVPKCRKNVL